MERLMLRLLLDFFLVICGLDGLERWEWKLRVLELPLAPLRIECVSASATSSEACPVAGR